MSSYLGRHASLYDLFYREKPYEKEAGFVHHLLQQKTSPSPKRLLELACGTGTHALCFSELGYEITGTDHSAGMLACARQKAAAAGKNIEFSELDMCRLPTWPVPYDAAVCLFDSIGYSQTDDALSSLFSGVWNNLKPGGLFVFEFWHAPAMLNHFEPTRVRRFVIPEGKIVRISETTLIPERSLARVHYDIYELLDNQSYQHVQETQTNRFFTVPEMNAWAQRQKFDPLSCYAGFDETATITDETWHVVAVWKKKIA
jgi:SAM-dependent methyltransferase